MSSPGRELERPMHARDPLAAPTQLTQLLAEEPPTSRSSVRWQNGHVVDGKLNTCGAYDRTKL